MQDKTWRYYSKKMSMQANFYGNLGSYKIKDEMI